jgi:hypothetical protein
MNFSFQQKSLRIYPLPYVDFKVGPQHIFYIQRQIAQLKLNNPDFPDNKIRSVFERALVSMAFADIYDKEDQFMKMEIKSFSYQKDFDFTHGNKRISLTSGRVNEKLEETGTKVKFRVAARVLQSAKADHYVMAAIHMPNIHLIGWVTAEDLASYVKGYSASIYAGCDRIKPMFELAIENKRRKGIFV